MNPELQPSSLHAAVTGLSRPESVLCLRDGGVLVSHLGAGVSYIGADGGRRVIGQTREIDGEVFVPNGIALLASGDLLLTNMGRSGGLWRLRSDGTIRAELREVEGIPLPATNFVLADGPRTWISVSTRQWPITNACMGDISDGFIILLDGRGARVVADGLCFANEVRLDGERAFLYVAETFAHRISRYPVTERGLGPRETYADLGVDYFPDGMAFDVDGGLWVASIISNRVLRIAPGGTFRIVLDDSDDAALSEFRRRVAAGVVTREDVQSARGSRLANVSSIAFGGSDLQTIYLGSLSGDTVYSFAAPVSGLPPAHWQQTFDI